MKTEETPTSAPAEHVKSEEVKPDEHVSETKAEELKSEGVPVESTEEVKSEQPVSETKAEETPATAEETPVCGFALLNYQVGILLILVG